MLFTVYDIRACLYDKKRTNYFAKAIKSVVKKNDTVVDAGSGSGILALLALKAGAGKVYAIESNPRQKKVILQNAKLNGFDNKIKVIIGDAAKVRLPEPVDVILCELIHTATFFEPQMQIINHLKKYLKTGGKTIPRRLYSYVELVSAAENFYGLKLSYESREAMAEIAASNKVKFDEIWFQENEPLTLRTVVKLKATRRTTVNALRFTGKLMLAKGLSLGATSDLLMPEIIFLQQSLKVVPGKNYFFAIAYKGGADSLDVKIKYLPKITKAILKQCNYLARPIYEKNSGK